MKKKLITKIAASAASLTLVAGAMVAPAGSALSNLTTITTSMAAFDNYYSRNLDSTGTFYVKLNNDYVENGVSRGTEAQITGVVDSKIPASGILTIPSRITVSGKNYDGKKFEPVTVPVTEIGPSAFIRQKSLISVNFPSSVKKIGFSAFENSGLVSLNIPSSITYIGFGAFRNCDSLYNVNSSCTQPILTTFTDCDNLIYFNNSPIINHNPKTGQPILNSSVEKELNGLEGSYKNVKKVPIIEQYMTEYINYIVKENTYNTDSDIIKAKKLHDWLILHTAYDIPAAESDEYTTSHEDWGPFLHRKSDGKYYSVCAGYAKAYKLLCDAAGVDCYYVAGTPLTRTSGGHAWNVVKINDNYYHVDTTWDDGRSVNYVHFMRSDSIFASNHEYKWSGAIDGEKKDYQTGIATYDMYDLGDVNDDGEVTEDDALEIQKYLLKTNDLSDEQTMRADINMDGEVKMNDAVSIYMALTKMKNDKYTKTLFEYIYIDGKMNV